jgi:SAM-dependent methyltransferase
VTHDLPGLFEGTEMPTAGWWEALWPDPAKVLHAVGLTPGMDVIDLCSGDAWFTLQIARVARHVLAIDLDARLLEVARVRLAESGLANCSFVVGNAYDVADLDPQLIGFELRPASLAHINVLAGVGRHDCRRGMTAPRAGDP